MRRRDALSTISLISGGVLVLPQIVLSGCEPGPYKYSLFNWGDTELLNEIAETILPATPEVPGAKAANVGDFIQNHVTTCFTEADQQTFLEGFKKFKMDIKDKYGSDFVSLDTKQKEEILRDQESVIQSKGMDDDFYKLLKGTVLFGYFTSEVGATKALRYVPIPGYQKGEIPYNGEPAWAL